MENKRSEVSKKILSETPQETKDHIKEYADALVNKTAEEKEAIESFIDWAKCGLWHNWPRPAMEHHKEEHERFERGKAIVISALEQTKHLQEKLQDERTALEFLREVDKDRNAEFEKLQEENQKLQAFKDYVHKRLDDVGIEKEPNGEHSNHGCRIGDRLDLVFQESSARLDLLNDETGKLQDKINKLQEENTLLKKAAEGLVKGLQEAKAECEFKDRAVYVKLISALSAYNKLTEGKG